MLIEFEDVIVDEENDRIILNLQTENHDYGFQKVIPITEDTDTRQGLRKHLEGMADAIAEEHNYGEAIFDFNSCGYFYVPEEEEPGEGHTQNELESKTKDELTDIASDLDVYEEDMDNRTYTKAMVIEKILEAQG